MQEGTAPMAPGAGASSGRKGSAASGPPRRRSTRRRPSLGGGAPAQDRELGRQGRETVRKLLEAGLAEFDENGFQAVRVDDVVRRANISHGTFYLYFSNKDDLFKTLLRDALHDMEVITGRLPRGDPQRGRAGDALRKWIRQVLRHLLGARGVLRILSKADVVGEEVYGDGLQQFFRWPRPSRRA